ncbi:PH domain-containing protein [Altererythrobacter endophyticus]|uniref:PH domain-containing protein n=2 Tax=Altericroceibacterium endophyticum TaxID=1808508 RepID=A0A6I4T3Z6_9SPHN|nr:PH domain-containing protein [Altericroceibacterium endophyticum]
MGKVFVGHPVKIGTASELYSPLLMEGEEVENEFKGVRDGAIFTSKRLIVYNRQGITGKKIEFSNFPWRSITAFSVENSGTFDLDAEVKICGSGWGVCEVVFTKGTDVRAVLRFMNGKVFG